MAQALRRTGFQVSQFESYRDPESGQIREVDVVASRGREVGGIAVSVALFLECKYCPRPWVVLTSPRRSGPFSYFSRILDGRSDVYEWRTLHTLQGRLLARILLSLGRTGTSQIDFFDVPRDAGYGIAEALKKQAKGKDSAYIAVMQAINCVEAHDIINEIRFERAVEEHRAQRYDAHTRVGEFSLFCSIAFPVVVVQGKIFECRLDADENVAVSEVDCATVVLPSKSRDEASEALPYHNVVRVVTEGHLQVFAAQAHEASKALLSQDLALREVWDHERPKIPGELRADDIPF